MKVTMSSEAESFIQDTIGSAFPATYTLGEIEEKYNSSPDTMQKFMDGIGELTQDLDITKHKFRIIEGYANTSSLDRVNDRVSPNAFANSLKTYMTNPILRYNHQKGAIIGHVFDARIDEKGLFIRAKINYNDEEADKAWNRIVQKSLRGLSVYGRIVKKQQMQDPRSGITVKDVSEFDLQEIAVVDIPANQDSLLHIVKKDLEVGKMEETQPQSNPATGS